MNNDPLCVEHCWLMSGSLLVVDTGVSNGPFCAGHWAY